MIVYGHHITRVEIPMVWEVTMVQAFNSLLEKWFFFKVYIVDYLDFLIFFGGWGVGGWGWVGNH